MFTPHDHPMTGNAEDMKSVVSVFGSPNGAGSSVTTSAQSDASGFGGSSGSQAWLEVPPVEGCEELLQVRHLQCAGKLHGLTPRHLLVRRRDRVHAVVARTLYVVRAEVEPDVNRAVAVAEHSAEERYVALCACAEVLGPEVAIASLVVAADKVRTVLFMRRLQHVVILHFAGRVPIDSSFKTSSPRPR